MFWAGWDLGTVGTREQGEAMSYQDGQEGQTQWLQFSCHVK